MRTAEALVRDMRALGRPDDQIIIVAGATHGGRLLARTKELLSMDPKKAAKLAPKVEPEPELPPILCSKCGCPLDDYGVCPEEANHIEEPEEVEEEAPPPKPRKTRGRML